jgi:hypothetical protein
MKTECQLMMEVVRFDGSAEYKRWETYPRAPVAGDYVVWGEGSPERVVRVELVPCDDDYAPTAWVYLETDVDLDREYDDDEISGMGYRPQRIRESDKFLTETGWERRGEIETQWTRGGKFWTPELFWDLCERALPGLD